MKWTERLRHLTRKQQFDPSLIGVFLNPFFLARRALRREISRLAATIEGGVLLDVGCGSKPYAPLLNVEKYIGLEIDTPHARQFSRADLFYDGGRFPVANNAVDVIMCNQVFEHVFNPPEFFAELNRTLKPGGILLLTVPFVWDEHEQPFDYARYSSFGLRHVLKQNGFDVLEQTKTLADFSLIVQISQAYLYKTLWTDYSLVNRIMLTFLFAPLSLMGLFLAHALPKNEDLYLDNIVLARSKVT